MSDAWSAYRSAVTALENGQYEPACEGFAALLAAGADDVRVRLGHGMALCRLGRIDAALGDFQQVLRQDGNNPELVFAIADSLGSAGQDALAERIYRQLLELCPEHRAAAHNLANLLNAAERFDEAAAVYSAALHHHPDDPALARDLAQSELDAGRMEAARQRLHALRDRLASRPDDDEDKRQTTFVLALADLCTGRWSTGWAGYEARWQVSEHAARDARWGRRWQGESLLGQHLLIIAEQGFGDSLLFARYLPPLAGEAARLSLRVPEPLRELFTRALAAWPNIDVASDSGEQTGHSLYTHLGSLPLHALSAARRTPQLVPPAPLPMYPRIAPAGAGAAQKTVGLVWRGQQTTVALSRRSLSLEQLLPALPYRGLRYVSLQIDATDAEKQLLENFGIADLSGGIASFQDTADRLAGLDALLSIDTAIAHLAGNLGRPLFLLRRRNAEWRWVPDGFAWYPRCTLLPFLPRFDFARLAAFGRNEFTP